MSWVQRHLRQKVTWWQSQGNDGFGGTTYASPVVIKARWEDRSELFYDQQGEEVRSESVVFVDRDLSEGDYVYLGVSGSGDPTAVSGARVVRNFRKLPGLRANVFERRAML